MGTLFECTTTNYPTWRAGAVIHGLMRFDQAVRDGTLAPESLDGRGNVPLCSYQYHRLYRHTRVPRYVCVCVGSWFEVVVVLLLV